MIKETVQLLGYKCKDKVSGFTGTIISVSFDLFGCVQIIVKPNVTAEGKLEEAHCFDVNRIEITSKERVMEVPPFDYVKLPAQYKQGPAEKAALLKSK